MLVCLPALALRTGATWLPAPRPWEPLTYQQWDSPGPAQV